MINIDLNEEVILKTQKDQTYIKNLFKESMHDIISIFKMSNPENKYISELVQFSSRVENQICENSQIPIEKFDLEEYPEYIKKSINDLCVHIEVENKQENNDQEIANYLSEISIDNIINEISKEDVTFSIIPKIEEDINKLKLTYLFGKRTTDIELIKEFVNKVNELVSILHTIDYVRDILNIESIETKLSLFKSM